MERCPNCGTLSRVGAKFCTTCGERIAGNDGDGAENEVVEVGSARRFGESPHTEVIGSWPSPTQAAEPAETGSSVDAIWAPPPAAWTPSPTLPVSGESVPTNDDAGPEEFASVWSGSAEAVWPAAPDNASGDAANPEQTPEQEIAAPPAPTADAAEPESAAVSDSGVESDDAFVATVAAEPVAEPRARIATLMDELRDAIAAIGGNDALDLTGVVSELDVAVTPPGAVKTEELAELREALLAAREHPRDIDTMIDLSGRINSILALIIAYDRATAAIERSLEVLRRT